MKRHHRAAVQALCGLAVVLAACAAETPAPAPDAAGDLTLQVQAITTAVGDAACDVDAQCRSIGVGNKPCGGPGGYLAWSIKATDPARLEALAARHREASRLDNARRGRISNCIVTPDPGAVCRPRAEDGKRVCQLGTGGQRGVD